ncbi:MAG: sigma-70 family RNA polymerase sigma factor [Spirochaetes bacterium]|nr:sigma-70 family RNA polymerase sigma factor [Spirochaetota bacterium]
MNQRAVRKKIEEFSQAYMEFYPVVYSSVLSRIQRRDDADDICQEIFIIFLDKFETIGNKRNWLYGTMKNILYNYYRKKNMNVDSVDNFDDVGLAFTNGFRDTRILIAEAMEEIECTEKDRIILEMVATYNYTYAHVGKALGLSRRQVVYRYEQVVKRIQDYFSQKGIKDIGQLL